MVRKEIDTYGNIRYLNEQGELHREDGPAVEFNNGDIWFVINNLFHSIDGPSRKYSDGREYYSIMGQDYYYKEWLAIKDYPLLW